MSFDSIAISILLTFSSVLHISDLPRNFSNWTTTDHWSKTTVGYHFAADSREIPKLCSNSPESYVVFPMVVMSSQSLVLDGTEILQFGAPDLRPVRSFYGAPSISCKYLATGRLLHWEITASTRYFARFLDPPKLTLQRPSWNVFAEIVNIVAAGSLFMLSIFTMILFWNKIPHPRTLSVSLSNFFISLYFLGTVAGLMGIPLHVVETQRIADLALLIGVTLFFNAFQLTGSFSRGEFRIYLGMIFLPVLLITFGKSGDLIQLGTDLAFGPMWAVLGVASFRLGIRHYRVSLNRETKFVAFSLLIFLVFGINDSLVILGLSHGHMLLSVGFMPGLLSYALSVNEQIMHTYLERDYLRNNLQLEVEKKTKELRDKSETLEQVVGKLRETQAELIQSEKLASLGTLSAGIAHEINNSLNYVYGSLRPIEKMVSELPEDPRKAKLLSLTKIMQEGMKLTFEIIKSLKNFTGLNQAKVNDFVLADVVSSVLTILRSKIKDHFVVNSEVDPEIRIYGSMVGMNQVLMNLLSNAIDAMPNGGNLNIKAESDGSDALIHVSDTGSGIPEEIRAKLFDPFFTTKEVGSGTGLGLYIVKKEIDRHHGTIEVKSEVGKGTTFTIRLPLRGMETMGVAA